MQHYTVFSLCVTLCSCVGSGLNDGQWHSVKLALTQDTVSISVDVNEGATANINILLPLSVDAALYFGGKRPYFYFYSIFCGYRPRMDY